MLIKTESFCCSLASLGSDIDEEVPGSLPVSPVRLGSLTITLICSCSVLNHAFIRFKVSDNKHDPLADQTQISNVSNTDGDHSTLQQTNISLNSVTFTVQITTTGRFILLFIDIFYAIVYIIYSR